MEEISFFQLPTRLARKLLALAEEHGDVVGSKIEIAMNISNMSWRIWSSSVGKV